MEESCRAEIKISLQKVSYRKAVTVICTRSQILGWARNAIRLDKDVYYPKVLLDQ